MHISQKSTTFASAFATMAQLVEQRIRNAWVAGSSPASGSKSERHPFRVSFIFSYHTYFLLPNHKKKNKKNKEITKIFGNLQKKQ